MYDGDVDKLLYQKFKSPAARTGKKKRPHLVYGELLVVHLPDGEKRTYIVWDTLG
jgi:hypothetical protein